MHTFQLMISKTMNYMNNTLEKTKIEYEIFVHILYNMLVITKML